MRRREVCIIVHVAPPAAKAIQRAQSKNEPRLLPSTPTSAPLLRLKAAHLQGAVQVSPQPGPEWHEEQLRWRPARPDRGNKTQNGTNKNQKNDQNVEAPEGAPRRWWAKNGWSHAVLGRRG